MAEVYVLHIFYSGQENGEYRQSVHLSREGAERELIAAGAEYFDNVMDEPLPGDHAEALAAIDARVPFEEWTIEAYEVQP